MKIIHVMNWFIENMGYQENYLPFCQAGLGNEVKVLCSRHYPRSRKFIKKNSHIDDISFSGNFLRIKRLRGLFLRFCMEQNWYFGLKREMVDFNPDIVHLHNIWDLPTVQYLLVNLFDRKGEIKVFVDNHIDNGNFEYKEIHKYLYYFGLIKRVIIPEMIKRKFVFISVNPYSQYCLHELFGIPQEKIKLLPLGVDNDKIFFSQEQREKIREKYGIRKNDIVFAFSGVFEQNKSLADLIAAFKILSIKYANIFLLLIGKGDLPKDEEFDLLRKRGRIILPGWQQTGELSRWYSVADIGVLPGKLGGLRDILAAGRPLIINDDLALSYLLEYENGLIFKRGDIRGLIQNMETYIKNADLILEHGRRSAKLTNDKLSWRKIAIKSLQIYNGLRS